MTAETLRLRQSTRTTDYIATYTGLAFWPLEPEVDDIRIEDIAHSLALQCRWNGHCKSFYSVAEHSVRVSWVVPPEDAPWGLMHDAGESLLSDWPRPLKRSGDAGPHFLRYEHQLMNAMCKRFGLPEKEPASVKIADNVLLLTEQRDLVGPQIVPWPESAERLPEKIVPWPWDVAEIRFLQRFRELFPTFVD